MNEFGRRPLLGLPMTAAGAGIYRGKVFMGDPRHELGRRGEELAAAHLKKLGYKIVDRNHVNALGELDLVAVDGSAVVVVEVKTRSKTGRSPAEAVDFRKRLKLARTAALYLKTKGWSERPTRFDVVEIINPPGSAPLIRHIKSAFDAPDY